MIASVARRPPRTESWLHIPDGHPTIRTQLAGQLVGWERLTVPQALRRLSTYLCEAFPDERVSVSMMQTAYMARAARFRAMVTAAAVEQLRVDVKTTYGFFSLERKGESPLSQHRRFIRDAKYCEQYSALLTFIEGNW